MPIDGIRERASSAIERPIVPPVPAAFSMHSQRSSVVSWRSSSSAGTTSSTASSKPNPRCEPTWKTTASEPIASAVSIVARSAVSEFSRTAGRGSRG